MCHQWLRALPIPSTDIVRDTNFFVPYYCILYIVGLLYSSLNRYCGKHCTIESQDSSEIIIILEMCGNGFYHSHSLPFPSIQFPFLPVPFPTFWLIPIPIWDSRVCYSHSLPFPFPYTQRYSLLYITTVHYCMGVTSSSIQYRNADHLLSLH